MAQVAPPIRVVLAALEDLEALVVQEDLVVQEAPVVQGDLVAQEGLVVPEAPEDPAGRTFMMALVTAKPGAALFVFRLEFSAFPMPLLMVPSAPAPQALGLRARRLFCPQWQR